MNKASRLNFLAPSFLKFMIDSICYGRHRHLRRFQATCPKHVYQKFKYVAAANYRLKFEMFGKHQLVNEVCMHLVW